MNVIVSNEQNALLSNLDVDVIKCVNGLYSVNDLSMMFDDLFYNKLIIDVTSIKDYKAINTFRELGNRISLDKIILFIPEGNTICTPSYLSQLVDIGVYNFTTNVEGIKYLLQRSNTYNDVAYIKNMANSFISKNNQTNITDGNNNFGNNNDIDGNNNNSNQNYSVVSSPNGGVKAATNCLAFKLGVKNLTEHSGATSLIYMMKRELASNLGDNMVLAVELSKNDFQFFKDPMMLSSDPDSIRSVLGRHSDCSIILIDLNNTDDLSICDDVLYLLDPGTLKLNKLIRRDRNVFEKLKGRKIILNRSLLNNKDVDELEYEARARFYYNLPPLNDRKHNDSVIELLSKLKLIDVPNNESDKIFGLFRR